MTVAVLHMWRRRSFTCDGGGFSQLIGRGFTHLLHVCPHGLRVRFRFIQRRHKTCRVTVGAHLVQCDALENNVTKVPVSQQVQAVTVMTETSLSSNVIHW